MGSPLGFGIRPPIFVKHKVFVSYHHRGDQAYYDAFSRMFHDNYESIYDNSLERRIDSENTDYVRRRIRENFITGSSCTIVLVGAETWGRKYVDWEIDATLEAGHALIGVHLPSLYARPDGFYNVPARLNDNINSGYAPWLAWSYITSSPTHLDAAIAEAKLKPALLIRNGRERRYRND